MPPRTAGRGSAARPNRAARGGKPVRGRGRGGWSKQKVEVVQEKEIVEPPPEKPKEISWVDKIPILPPPPDQELHLQMSKERKEKRYQKVFGYCKEEMESILNYIFEIRPLMHENPRFFRSRKCRSIREQFRKGNFLPKQEEVKIQEEKKEVVVELKPTHSIDIENYLQLKQGPFYSDLSSLFNVEITDDRVADPNKEFNDFLDKIQEKANLLPEKYTVAENPYPFIVVINGPPFTGVTTICQLLMTAYQCTVIEARYVPPPDTSRRKKSIDAESFAELPPEYNFKDSIIVRYSDDKTALSQISSIIKESDRSKGIILCGYPSTKSQVTALEKAISVNNAPQIRPNSARSSVKSNQQINLSISGFIFTSHNGDLQAKRKIDPETGFVFSEDFHMPSCAELVGESVFNFVDKKKEIEERLVDNENTNSQPISSKVLSQWNTFASGLKKNYQILEINHPNNDLELAKQIDEFMQRCLKTDVHLVEQLLDPQYLHLPYACCDAITTWRRCLEIFGRKIADQKRLISTIDSKVEKLSESALVRFQLISSIKDNRDSIKEENCDNREAFFNKIWEESIRSREKNIEYANEIIEKSGLVELVFSIVQAPKNVFINLVEKIAYVKWFYERFNNIFIEGEDYNLFRTIDDIVQPPVYEFSIYQETEPNTIDGKELSFPTKMLDEKAKNERDQKIQELGVQYLSKYLEKDPSSVKSPTFDSKAAIETLDIHVYPQFPPASFVSKQKEENSPLSSSRSQSQSQSQSTASHSEQTNQQVDNNPSTASHTELPSILTPSKPALRVSQSIGSLPNVILSNYPPNTQYPNKSPKRGNQGGNDFLFSSVTSLTMPTLSRENSSFTDLLSYYDNFIGYVERNAIDDVVRSDCHSLLQIFDDFNKELKNIEVKIVKSVFDLHDTLVNHAFKKFATEMELFSTSFNFQYDFSFIPQEFLSLSHLANQIEVKNVAPLLSESLIEYLKKETSSMHGVTVNDIINLIKDQEEFQSYIDYLELFIRIIECSECFDPQLFLSLFES